MTTLQHIFELAMSGSPLTLLVLGLVQWLKQFGLQGNAIVAASMGTGLVFGGVYLYASTLPTDLLGWFYCIVYGLLLGLVASGIFQIGTQLADRAAGKP